MKTLRNRSFFSGVMEKKYILYNADLDVLDTLDLHINGRENSNQMFINDSIVVFIKDGGFVQKGKSLKDPSILFYNLKNDSIWAKNIANYTNEEGFSFENNIVSDTNFFSIINYNEGLILICNSDSVLYQFKIKKSLKFHRYYFSSNEMNY